MPRQPACLIDWLDESRSSAQRHLSSPEQNARREEVGGGEVEQGVRGAETPGFPPDLSANLTYGGYVIQSDSGRRGPGSYGVDNQEEW